MGKQRVKQVSYTLSFQEKSERKSDKLEFSFPFASSPTTRSLNFFFLWYGFRYLCLRSPPPLRGPWNLRILFSRNHLNLAVFYTAGSGTQGSMPAREVSASALVTFLLLW